MEVVDTALDLLLIPSPGAIPVRASITKLLTTVGSDPAADVRLAIVPGRWLILQRVDDAVMVRHLASSVTHRLATGGSLDLDGVALSLARRGQPDAADTPGLPLERLSQSLCEVDAADGALRAMLREMVLAADADVGAIVVLDDGVHSVAVAEHRGGEPLENPAELLSDTILRDVLNTSESVCLRDAAGHDRYKNVPSVLALRLRSVLCVPMALSGRVMGAIFLGRHGVQNPFPPRYAHDLAITASMALPLLAQLRRLQRPTTGPLDQLIGESESMRAVRRLIGRVASSELSVLVLGETGTGKEVAARAIHESSARGSRPLVAINCAAVPESLLGTELFGCKKGAFTGALADRRGRIEEAHGTTLFLDEVGDMSAAMQSALLRAIEQREVTRIGENTPRQSDFRLIAATHRDLEAEVAAGRFRQDLLFRLREVTVTLPPLSTRGDDVLGLAKLFLRQTEEQLGVREHRIGEDARRVLMAHKWPGNVRELRAAMRRAALLCDGAEIKPADLQLGAAASATESVRPAAITAAPGDDLGDLERPLAQARDEYVTRFIAAVVERHGGNRERAAASLGISVRSLYRLG